MEGWWRGSGATDSTEAARVIHHGDRGSARRREKRRGLERGATWGPGEIQDSKRLPSTITKKWHGQETMAADQSVPPSRPFSANVTLPYNMMGTWRGVCSRPGRPAGPFTKSFAPWAFSCASAARVLPNAGLGRRTAARGSLARGATRSRAVVR